MDTNQSIYHDQIDAYLRDELSTEDKAFFEESLQNNSELLKEFRIHQELFAQADESTWINESFSPDKKDVQEVEKYFISKEAQEFKDLLVRAQSNYKKRKQTPSFNRKLWMPLLVAASIALFVVLYTMSSGDSPQDLYASYNQWQDLPSLTSRSDENQLAEGQLLFEQKQYKDSYKLFKDFVENNNEVLPPVLIYSGLSALELDKYTEAISYFDQLIDSDAIDQSKGYWYKVLVYLKQGKKKEAIEVLEIITQDGQNYNFKEAETLLKKLQ
ncbi:tetratricopeptide repeat protein [Aquimarina sp. 2201CG14-23]|uniref:tetratricopeptide repeat protein n=1 Tax=Aquimarina mycalae TaxID=3040073 RepID=UPI0024781934|nr:tetratricopeptide repeat protein [Aquimarina sp. 2201CG14-23]MDH7445034.1 hypothetical protein [Aquimarina sp. 2201CG14-23]